MGDGVRPAPDQTTGFLDARRVGDGDLAFIVSVGSGYNQVDLLISMTDPRGYVTQYQYDKAGNRTLVWDASNNKTTFVHDKLNRVTRETDPLGKAIRYSYDDASRLTSITDRLNRVRSFGYDEANRKTSETWYTGPTINQVQSFGYDDVGNLTSTTDPDGNYTLTYDAANRVVTESGPYGITRTFSYDEAGNRYLVTDNKGGTEVSTYDLANRLTSRTLSVGGQSSEVEFTYTKRGELETETRSVGTDLAGTTKYVYNDDGQLRFLTHRNAAGVVVADYSYLYDLAGRLTNKTENGVSTIYDYDAAGQLIQDGDATFTYDPTGNRNMPGYGTSTGNRITTDGDWTFGYDNAGRVTSRTKTGEVWTYVYDHRGSLISATKRNGVGVVQGAVSYKYDAWGNLIRQTENGVGGVTISDERFAVDGWDTAKPTPVGTENFDSTIDLDQNGTVVARRMFGAGFDDVVARIDQQGVSRWYGTDRQGSIRQIFDNAGSTVASSDFDAWGNVIAGSLTDRYGFTGLDWDPFTKLSMPASGRPYDSGSGRWLAGDEKGFDAGDVNLYRYVGNGPTNGVDPSGYIDPALLRALRGENCADCHPKDRTPSSTPDLVDPRLSASIDVDLFMRNLRQHNAKTNPSEAERRSLPEKLNTPESGIISTMLRRESMWEANEYTLVVDGVHGRYRVNANRIDNPDYLAFREAVDLAFNNLVRQEEARRRDQTRPQWAKDLDLPFHSTPFSLSTWSRSQLSAIEKAEMRQKFVAHMMQFAPANETLWVPTKPIGPGFPKTTSKENILAFDKNALANEEIEADLEFQERFFLWGSALRFSKGLDEWNAGRKSTAWLVADFALDVAQDTDTALMLGGVARLGGRALYRQVIKSRLPTLAPGARAGSVTHSPDWKSVNWSETNSRYGIVPRNAATPAEASIKDVLKNGWIPGEKGVVLTDRTILWDDLWELTQMTKGIWPEYPHGIEFGLGYARAADGTIVRKLYSGTGVSVVWPEEVVRKAAHVHPSGIGKASASDITAWRKDYATLRGLDPNAPLPPAYIIYGPAKDGKNVLVVPSTTILGGP